MCVRCWDSMQIRCCQRVENLKINQNKINSTIKKYLGIYSHNILHSNENEWTKTTHNMAESHRHNVEQKNPDTKRYIVCDSFSIKNKKRQTSLCY